MHLHNIINVINQPFFLVTLVLVYIHEFQTFFPKCNLWLNVNIFSHHIYPKVLNIQNIHAYCIFFFSNFNIALSIYSCLEYILSFNPIIFCVLSSSNHKLTHLNKCIIKLYNGRGILPFFMQFVAFPYW